MSAISRAARCVRGTHALHRWASTQAFAVVADGAVSRAVAAQQINVPDTVSAGQVRVSWLAAGIDPIDFSAGTKTAPNGASGTEGVAVVDAVGSGVTTVKEGDVVIPIKTNVGTWCASSEVSATDVLPISAPTRMELAATLTASPFTALRLISDFASLAPGDVILQNEASSAVGTAVVQIAAALGFRTVSLVRESMMDYAPTVERLKLMGGDVVIGESYANSAGFKSVMADLPAPKLALNGSPDAESAATMVSLLSGNATVVSYPPGIPSSVVANDKLKAETFSLSDWLENADRKDVESMVSVLTDLVEQEKLTAWLQRVPFEDLPAAVQRGTMLRRKLVAIMSQP